MAKPIRGPRDRKSKHRQRSTATSRTGAQDSNSSELLPLSKAEKDERRHKLEAELRAQQPKMSRQKQKRLDKYMAKKLRKDENLTLIKKLAQAKVDTSLMKSSKTLGVVRETRIDRHVPTLRGDEAESDDSTEGEADGGNEEGSSSDITSNSRTEGDRPAVLPTGPSPKTEKAPSKVAPNLPTLGSGLKRPLELDEDGKPLITKRRKRVKRAPILSGTTTDTWNGIGSGSASPILGDDAPFDGDENGSRIESMGSGVGNDSHSLSSDDTIDEASENSTEETGDEESDHMRERITAFKAWADNQRNQVLGFEPTASALQAAAPVQKDQQIAVRQTRQADQEPLPPELEIKEVDRKAFAVEVERPPEIQAHRLALPVVMEEHRIMEAIHSHAVAVICGATGSGKTTQIPQFLFEAGYGNPNSPNPGMIGVTQPRRVAAVSMAKRVAVELGRDSNRVAYKIRFEGTVQEKTSIKFMTDGILLREASEDITLGRYSAIVIDEAHEMSKDTSILIGMMSRIIKLRERLSTEDDSIKPLKLIIMSATLTVADLINNKNLFAIAPPVVQIEGRQYPVTIHWARKTNRDYVEEAYRKIRRGHRTLPPGAMLVFLTGRNEIVNLSSRLKRTFKALGAGAENIGTSVRLSGEEAPVEIEDVDLGPSRSQSKSDPGDVPSSDATDNDEEDEGLMDTDPLGETAPIHVLPLYSLLPTDEQLRVFEPPPEGSRLIVLATNIAETSLTIPGIRYVFDCGRVKERRYNDETGVQSFDVGWISKASATQRAGRAGRTGSGHCYRLYSSAVYERDFEERIQPELQRTPLEGVVLQLMGLGVPNILDTFPFPTPPDPLRLTKAKNLLSYLGALSKSNELTDLGHKMSAFPLLPRFSKVLLSGDEHACFPYTIALVAALSVPDLFIPEESIATGSTQAAIADALNDGTSPEDELREARLKAYNQAHARFSRFAGDSDALRLLAAVLAYSEAPDSTAFCARHFLRPKAMREVQMLREQLNYFLRADPSRRASIPSNGGSLPKPSEKQLRYLKQVVASGFIDQVAIRADLAPTTLEQPRKPKRAINVAYMPLFPRGARHDEEEAVYIHPSSVLARMSPTNLPPYIIYSRLQQSASSTKVRMHPLTPVSAPQLALLTRGTPLQSDGKPIKEVVLNEPDGIKRTCWVVPTLRGSSGTQGWPLPARKVVQRRRNGVWVDAT